MAEQFVNGHAVIVGVGADLPTTVQDAAGLGKILCDPERCAYPADQVRVLTAEKSTRDQVLRALDRLIEAAAEDATVVIYYSGHGYEVRTAIGKEYFLMPYGYDLSNLPDTAIRGHELTERIRAIRARKILLLLDCCHAGGFDPTKSPGVQLTKAPMPVEAQQLLAEGRGLVVVASSRASEKSFAGKPYSAFTLALVEALAGEGAAKQDGYVRVADLALYTGKRVPARTHDRQHPILSFEQADNFPVAYYAAGDSTPKALPFEVKPEIEAEPGDLDRAALDQRGQTVHGTQTNISGGGTYVGGHVGTGGGKFVGRDDRSRHYYGAETPIDAKQAEAIYRRHIADRCGVLPLQSIDASPSGGEAEPLSLAQVYIGLDTRQSARAKAIEKALARAAQGTPDPLPAMGPTEPHTGREEETRPVSALEAVILNRRLVLTGEPGSGKSTFVNHLTYALALGRRECLSGWPAPEHNALPVPVTLREFARWLSTTRRDDKGKLPDPSASLLWDYIVHDLTQRRLAPAAPVLEKALEDGRAVVLLDGLDEVPADEEALLERVKASVQQFVERYQQSRQLVTCRVLSYEEPHWKLPTPAFPDVELAPFDEQKIDRFIAAWYSEVGTKWCLSQDEIETLSGKLSRAVRRPDLWRLAPNPLLLTVMALVHSRRRELPEKRALLYEEAVDILLQKREQDKTVNAPMIRELLDEAGRDFNDLKAVLEKLAFDTHGSGTVRGEDDGAPIDTLTLLEQVAALHPKVSYDWARRLLEALRLRASLLLERTERVFSFPHRTFQEYLAGVYLARLPGDEFAKQAARLAGDLPTYWREVVLLAVGYLVHSPIRDTSKPRLLVEELCAESPLHTDADWRRLWLAGDVLREVGTNRVRDTAHGRQLLARVCSGLTDLLEQGALSARERAEAGDLLGELGDPRFDPDRHFLPCRYRGEPEPMAGFVEIPQGPFVMGEDDEAQDLRIDYSYWVARYPVTVAQFGAFVEAGGYQMQRLWTQTGWDWRQGRWDSQVEEEWLRDWLKGRPKELRGEPMGWREQRAAANRPVMGVSWLEALAYCRWLQDVLRWAGSLSPLEDERYAVRLPTEAEWEKAVRVGDARAYPWGAEAWDPERANVSDSDIGHPTPVGMYPRGATSTTSSALHDVSGNVWEWALNLYQPYPYRSEPGRSDLEAEGSRVVRGGSWDDNQRDARCAFRDRVGPVNFDFDLGFRLVLSLADSGF